MTIDGLKKEATITSGAQARDTRALNFPLILHSMQPLTFLLPTVVTFILGQVRVVQASCDPSNQYTALTFTSKAFSYAGDRVFDWAGFVPGRGRRKKADLNLGF
ncbi:conserved hypothetical protein [Coccidioides posadasii str. Silveira]|uniref:Uncharacterized protein n=1 Tax=Coccidioides posadasii (strain RMSCC 757 / Silveira) TaxID=443226 RepID=E9D5F7_COCPS|nr:conserved hypothetical protein [Coccidioides posadasii str. Silveira]